VLYLIYGTNVRPGSYKWVANKVMG